MYNINGMQVLMILRRPSEFDILGTISIYIAFDCADGQEETIKCYPKTMTKMVSVWRHLCIRE